MELFLHQAEAEAAAAGLPPPQGRLAKVAAALAQAPRFLILDFRKVGWWAGAISGWGRLGTPGKAAAAGGGACHRLPKAGGW